MSVTGKGGSSPGPLKEEEQGYLDPNTGDMVLKGW